MRLEGIFPPLTTPFAADGAFDAARLKANIARYNRTRLAGYVLNGSTGESVLLGWDDVERVWAAAREASAPGKILIAGTGAESTGETIQHTNRAAELGYQAALVRTPSYYKPSMTFEAEAAHFLRVADASRLPILIYSVPAFTGLTVEAPLVLRLAQHENIIGIKDSSGSVQRIAEIVASASPSFQTLTGSARTLAESLSVGAVGAILALSCVFPEPCVDAHEAVRSGDVGRAKKLQKQVIAPGAKLIEKHGIPGIKYAMDRLGYYGGPARPPLLPLSVAAQQEIDDILARVALTIPAGS